MRRRAFLTAATTVTAIGLAGCSGGGDGTDTSATTSTTEATDTETKTPSETDTPGETATSQTTTAGRSDTTDETTTTATVSGTTTPTETASAATTAQPTDTATPTPTPTPTQTTTETAIKAPVSTTDSGGSGFGPKTFSGSGTTTTETFELASGPVTAKFSHDGESNFIVKILALEGESYDDVLLTNVIGEVEGKQVETVSAAGGQKLNVNADGDWKITLEQPSNPGPKSLPIDASGEGLAYIGPYEFDGPTTFKGSHDGDSNFIVTPIPVDPSNMMVSVFNKIGTFKGSTTARVNGLAYLNINANGAWTLSTGE